MIFRLMCAHGHHILHFILRSILFSNKNNYANDTRTSTPASTEGGKTLRRRHARILSLWKRRRKNEESIYISFQDLNLMEAQSDKKFLCIRIQRRSYANQNDLNAPVLFTLIFIFPTFAVVILVSAFDFFLSVVSYYRSVFHKGKNPHFLCTSLSRSHLRASFNRVMAYDFIYFRCDSRFLSLWLSLLYFFSYVNVNWIRTDGSRWNIKIIVIVCSSCIIFIKGNNEIVRYIFDDHGRLIWWYFSLLNVIIITRILQHSLSSSVMLSGGDYGRFLINTQQTVLLRPFLIYLSLDKSPYGFSTNEYIHFCHVLGYTFEGWSKEYTNFKNYEKWRWRRMREKDRKSEI